LRLSAISNAGRTLLMAKYLLGTLKWVGHTRSHRPAPIWYKNTRKNDKLSHLPAFRRPSRTERQPRSGPAATQTAVAEPL